MPQKLEGINIHSNLITYMLERIRIQQNKLTQSFLRLQKVTDLKNINVNVLL